MTLPPSRLHARDVLGVGSTGLRSRKLRAALSALGIAIGIASMVAVLGISASSQADLLRTIDRLGTNLLSVQAGESAFGEETALPEESVARVTALPGVERAAATYDISDVTPRRSEFVDVEDDLGLAVSATTRSLPQTMGAEIASGHFLTAAEERFPTAVLGATAAQRLGITSTDTEAQVFIDGRYYLVVGILEPVTLDSNLDRAVLVGYPAARKELDLEPEPTQIYVRANEDQLTSVRELLAASANAENPEEVSVSRPSDALEAKAAAEGAFTSLLLGLGAVALLVGGVGIANVMVISVLERRSEIGLRRALGATRRHISTQFLTEALLLSALGGCAGALLGATTTAVAALTQGQPVVVPPEAVLGGVAAALLIGATAGLYPSVRAARLSPTEALRTV